MAALDGRFRNWSRIAGLAMMVVLAIHPWLRPEGGWALLSACDLAALVTACGLIAGADKVVATAFLFQLFVGLPALVIGMLTTYQWNATGLAIHIAPIVIGAVVVSHARGVPPRAALHAWIGYAGSLLVATLVVPPHLNINFSSKVWAPLADTLSLRTYQGLVVVEVGVLLIAGQFVAGRWFRRRSLIVA